MVQNLQFNEPKHGENFNRCNMPNNVQNLQLSDFVTRRTRRFFDITRINMNFLKIHPRQWSQDLDYLSGQKKAMSVSVTNDAAERSIALYQKYKDNVKKPCQEQHLMQVAEKRRRECKQLRKQDVINSLDFH